MTYDLGAEDYDSVAKAMGTVGRTSLNELIGEWGQLVGAVEQGYGWTTYEYDNELSCRDAISTAWPILTDRVRHLREPEVEALDARFRAATVAASGSVGDETGWWRSRSPRRTDRIQV